MKKKFICIILAALCALFCFAGCDMGTNGGGTTNDVQQTLDVGNELAKISPLLRISIIR